MEKSQFFSYAGFHFKLCSLELRELFASIFNAAVLKNTIKKYLSPAHEFVPIYTCNRFDICIFGQVDRTQVLNLFYDLAIQAVQSRFQTPPVCHKELKTHISDSLRFEVDEQAVKLFFEVASSLDSLVLGETQILGQLKTSYLNAKLNGFSGKKSASFFDHCFKTAKRIRSETDLFKHVISIGHLAVECAQKEFTDITNKKMAVFGSGEMALLTAKHLLYHGVKNLFIANRTFANAEWLCQTINAGNPLSLSDAMKNLSSFDVCITACGGEDLLIKYEHLSEINDNVKKLILFIDISMPRKIDIKLSQLNNVKVINIDQLSEVVEKNKKARASALQAASQIILEETFNFIQKKQHRENSQEFINFNAWLNQTVQHEIDKFLLKKSTKSNIKSDVVARALCKKVNSKIRNHREWLI